MTTTQVRTAIVAGVVVGLLSMMSMLLVLLAVSFWLLIRAATRDLGPRERRWVVALVSIALALRVAAIASLVLQVDPSRGSFAAFFGDGLYAIKRSIWLRNSALGIPIAPEYFTLAFDPYGWSGYHYLLAAVQIVTGPSPIGLHLLSSFFFLSTLLLMYRLFRQSYGVHPAILTLGLLLFIPTLFAWSVSVLKESFHLCLMVLVLLGALHVIRGPTIRHRAGGLVLLVGSMAAVNTMRSGALAIVAMGLVLGCLMRLMARSVWVFVPSAVLLAATTTYVVTRPAIQARALDEVRLAANRHVGQVLTEGQGYKILDDRFYIAGGVSTPTMTVPEAQRFVIRGAMAFVLVPLPWDVHSLSGLVYLPQQIIWYVLLVCAAFGLPVAWRRDALVTSIICGYALVGLVVIAPNSGNVGTLVRHRDLILPFVAWIGAVGVICIAARVTRRALGAMPARVFTPICDQSSSLN